MGRSYVVYLAIILMLSVVAGAAECERAAATIASDVRASVDRLTEIVANGSASSKRRSVLPRSESALIDDEIFGAMKAAGISPAGLASDEEFLRRVTLDLTGQIPSPAEVQAFLADSRHNKRALLVDRLLASDAFNDRWSLFLGDLVRNTSQPFVGAVNSPQRNQLHDYLRAAVQSRKPYDQLVRELITASGHGEKEPAANFIVRDFLLGSDPIQDTWDNLTVSTHRTFLGVNLFCVSCHDGQGHTTLLSPWLTQKKREHFWESAAFFANVKIRPAPGGSIYDSPFEVSEEATEYRLNTTSGNKTPRLPANAGGREVIEPAFILTGETPAPGENRRAALARMITAHPQFARATANYLWKEMFVVGIVEPANGFDMLRQDASTTPSAWSVQPTHPRLLDRLAEHFVKNGYDLRAMLRLMANSNAYQLSSSYPGQWQSAYTRYFARHFARRLRSEELSDAVSAATGVWEPIAVRDGTTLERTVARAGQLPDVAEPTEARGPETKALLDAFMRGNRNDTPRSDELGLSQALVMMNNPAIIRRIEGPSSRGRTLLAGGATAEAIVRELYLATLGRRPSADEAAAAVGVLKAGNGGVTRESVEDLQYALINKLEFVFNH